MVEPDRNTTTLRENSNSMLNLLLFFIVSFCVWVCLHTSLTIIPLYVVEIGGTKFDAGLQTSVFFVSAIFFRIYLGPMTDIKGRKLPLLIGVFVFTTTPLLFLLSTNIWALIGARTYQAVGLAAFLSSASSFVADTAPVQKIGTYLGAYRITNILALLFGPPAAVFVINYSNFNSWFLINSALFLIAVPIMAVISTPRRVSEKQASSMQKMIHTLKQRNLWPLFLGIAMAALGYGTIINFGSLFVSEYSEVANPGIYFTYLAVAGIAASISAGYLSDRFGRPIVVWPTMISLGLGTISLFLLPTIPLMLVVSSVLVGIGFFGGMLTLIAWLVELADFNIRGTALAVQENIIDGTIGIASFVFGAASTWVGMPVSFTVLGLIILLPSIYLLVNTLSADTKERGVPVENPNKRN